MGSALKVISMRIRGMKGELEDLGEEYDNIESISKIQTQILNLTSGKVNIFDDNGNFRSTYDILKDISEIYEGLYPEGYEERKEEYIEYKWSCFKEDLFNIILDKINKLNEN